MGFDNLGIKVSNKYLRIKGGETVDIHILDKEPLHKMVHWINDKKSDCGGAVCADCQQGEDRSDRWLTNVWNRKLGIVQIFEFGTGIAIDIQEIAKSLAEDGHTIHSTDLRIMATGSGKGTKYKVFQKTPSGTIPEDVKLWEIK